MAEPIRVLELCDAWAVGGTALDYHIRAVHLDRNLFRPLAVGFADGGPWLEAAGQAGVSTATCAGSIDRLDRLVADFKPHIVHYLRMSALHPLIVEAQRSARRHGVAVEVETNMFGRPALDPHLQPPTLIRHVSQASMLRYAELAGTTIRELHRRGDRVVYLPILAGRFATMNLGQADRRAFRSQLGFDDSHLVACRVGRADMRKWSQRLECAIPQMLDALPQLRFVFQTAPESKVARLCSRYGDRVIALPLTSDPQVLARLYNASDCMIHSSAIGESFGCSVAEGMYWRLPVVVDSTPEVDNAQVELVDHGESGLIVRSVRGFVAAVTGLAGDAALRRRLGEAAHQKAARLYSEQAVTRLWEKHYIERLCQADGRAVSEEHRAHAAAAMVPGEIDEANWAQQYTQRLGRFDGPVPGWSELLGLRVRAGWDTMTYARQAGPLRVWRALRDRLKAGRLLRRA